jgi:hypothetical protein
MLPVLSLRQFNIAIPAPFFRCLDDLDATVIRFVKEAKLPNRKLDPLVGAVNVFKKSQRLLTKSKTNELKKFVNQTLLELKAMLKQKG